MTKWNTNIKMLSMSVCTYVGMSRYPNKMKKLSDVLFDLLSWLFIRLIVYVNLMLNNNFLS